MSGDHLVRRTSRRRPPYYSQFESPRLISGILRGELAAADDPLWQRSGASDRDEYDFWAWRSCGVACLRSILELYLGVRPAAVPLAKALLDAGAYRPRPDGGLDGLIYAPFAAYLSTAWGLRAEVRTRYPMDELRADVEAGCLVMASVNSSIRMAPAPPPVTGGHLVLVYAAAPDWVEFHNPSGHTATTQSRVRLPGEVFGRYFAMRGIAVYPPSMGEAPGSAGEEITRSGPGLRHTS